MPRRAWQIGRERQLVAELAAAAGRRDLVPTAVREARWPAGGSRVAAFDADGTLWRGDIAEELTVWLVDAGLVARACYEAYEVVNARDPVAGCFELVKLFRGISEARFTEEVERFWSAGPTRRWMEPVLAALWHLSELGFAGYVVSASPALLLDPLLRWLPIGEILGLELAVDARGVLTGGVTGTPTVAAGKATRLRERWAGPVHFAAGNGVLDVALLELAEHLAWAVNPDATLLAAAERHGWLVTRIP